MRLPDGFQVAISSLCGPGERYKNIRFVLTDDKIWDNYETDMRQKYEVILGFPLLE